MSIFSFKPHQVTKKLIKDLPERAQDVIVRRYGLSDEGNIMTLESIGGMYGITRERVRQIENHALGKIRQSSSMAEHGHIFDEIFETLKALGYVVPEEYALLHLSARPNYKNHINFLLVLGDPFIEEKEDAHFKHRWHMDRKVADAVYKALHKIHETISDDELVSEDEIIQSFRRVLDLPFEVSDNDILKRWLSLSKVIDRNPLGEWGKSSSPNVRVKGMRDFAYLVIRQHGSPMHFTEVTKKIQQLFGKNAHVATTHNELIKDDRFVLVGRGLYALKSWGYVSGIVKDVIVQILTKNGPLMRDEIMDLVLKERYVKPNTIVVNLQDTGVFKKNKDGTYSLAK